MQDFLTVLSSFEILITYIGSDQYFWCFCGGFMSRITENFLMDIRIESSVNLKKINYIWLLQEYQDYRIA